MSQSLSHEGARGVRLTVTAGSPLAEVFLVDHSFGLVNRSIGDLTCSVEPGVYKIKAKVGDAAAERLVLLDHDSDIDLAEELRIGSAAPIEGTTRTREQDMHAATVDSRRIAESFGSGAGLFVMARRWDDESGERIGKAHNEVSLWSFEGSLLADLTEAAGSGGVTLEVDPGAYLLRYVDASGVTVEAAAHAVDGWQTQVFILEDASDVEALGRTRVSVLMARHGFDPHDHRLELVEHARTALADERKVGADFVNDMVGQEIDDPMLAMYAAHLMLVARDAERESKAATPESQLADRPQAPVHFEQPRFDCIVDALRDMLGPWHPDVVALQTQTTNGLDAPHPLMAPPILWRSWVLLIDASNDAPQLVSVTMWRRVRTPLPLRPFLLWSVPESETDLEARWSEGLAGALAAAQPPATKRPPRGGLSEALLSRIELSGAAAPGPVAGDEVRRRVSQQLLAPRAAVDEVAARAAR